MNAAGRLYPLKRVLLWAAVPASVGGLWGLSYYLRQHKLAPLPDLQPGASIILDPQPGQPPQVQVKLTSNENTAKWNVYTSRGRDFFSEGRIDEAEKYFTQAIEEAKKGFGEDDAHVASSLNNLAELYRLKKEYEKAEPLYLEAVDRLKESMGPEHPSVAFALHNLGGFYLLQKDFAKSIDCYERALKIKGRGLGLNHPDYANTMFHLGKVMQLTGRLNEADALIRHSIQILEDGGFGESQSAIRRMVILADILVQTSQLQEAESLQRKILHSLEMTQGPEAPSTISALENLASTLMLQENFDEAEEVLKRCLESKQKSSSGNEIQIWDSLFKLACVSMGRAGRLAADKAHGASMEEYDKAMILTQQAMRIAQEKWNTQQDVSYLLPLVRSFNMAGLIGMKNMEVKGGGDEESVKLGEDALRECLKVLEGVVMSREMVGEKLKCLEKLGKLSGNSKISRQAEEVRSEMNKGLARV